MIIATQIPWLPFCLRPCLSAVIDIYQSTLGDIGKMAIMTIWLQPNILPLFNCILVEYYYDLGLVLDPHGPRIIKSGEQKFLVPNVVFTHILICNIESNTPMLMEIYITGVYWVLLTCTAFLRFRGVTEPSLPPGCTDMIIEVANLCTKKCHMTDLHLALCRKSAEYTRLQCGCAAERLHAPISRYWHGGCW